jgi:hypothetical protein
MLVHESLVIALSPALFLPSSTLGVNMETIVARVSLGVAAAPKYQALHMVHVLSFHVNVRIMSVPGWFVTMEEQTTLVQSMMQADIPLT